MIVHIIEYLELSPHRCSMSHIFCHLYFPPTEQSCIWPSECLMLDLTELALR